MTRLYRPVWIVAYTGGPDRSVLVPDFKNTLSWHASWPSSDVVHPLADRSRAHSRNWIEVNVWDKEAVEAKEFFE